MSKLAKVIPLPSVMDHYLKSFVEKRDQLKRLEEEVKQMRDLIEDSIIESHTLKLETANYVAVLQDRTRENFDLFEARRYLGEDQLSMFINKTSYSQLTVTKVKGEANVQQTSPQQKD